MNTMMLANIFSCDIDCMQPYAGRLSRQHLGYDVVRKAHKLAVQTEGMACFHMSATCNVKYTMPFLTAAYGMRLNQLSLCHSNKQVAAKYTAARATATSTPTRVCLSVGHSENAWPPSQSSRRGSSLPATAPC